MVEIKEEDIEITQDGEMNDTIMIHGDYPYLFVLKQQILQDHEEAKTLEKLRPKIDKISKNDKELFPIMMKNIQIVKRLEERQEKWKKASRMSEEQVYAFRELQKILDGSE